MIQLYPLFERGVSHTGKLVIALVNEIMNFAVNKGIIEFNKCINVSKAFNVNRTTHHPTIRPENYLNSCLRYVIHILTLW